VEREFREEFQKHTAKFENRQFQIPTTSKNSNKPCWCPPKSKVVNLMFPIASSSEAVEKSRLVGMNSIDLESFMSNVPSKPDRVPRCPSSRSIRVHPESFPGTLLASKSARIKQVGPKERNISPRELGSGASRVLSRCRSCSAPRSRSEFSSFTQ
jgi:hypothetical protein